MEALPIESKHLDQLKLQIFGFPLLKMCHLKMIYTPCILHQLKSKLDEGRSHIPKRNSTKVI